MNISHILYLRVSALLKHSFRLKWLLFFYINTIINDRSNRHSAREMNCVEYFEPVNLLLSNFFQFFIRIHVDKYRKVVNENEYLLYREDIHFHPSLSYITHHPPQPQSPSPIIQRNQSWTLIPPSHSLPTTSIYHAHCQPLSIIYYLPFITRTPPLFLRHTPAAKTVAGKVDLPVKLHGSPVVYARSVQGREGRRIGEKSGREGTTKMVAEVG